MERLTVDTTLTFCDIAQCSSTQGGSNCEDGYCDQRRVYERLREYELTGLEPDEVDQFCRAAKTMMFEDTGDFVRRSIANFEALQEYRSHGTVEEFRTLKEAEQKRREGCEWCIGFCPDVTGDPHSDYRICPHCGRDLRGESHG